MLRKAVAAGTIAWATPLALGSTARAGVFTTKCTPTLITSSDFEWDRILCEWYGTAVRVEVTLAGGLCPCGGTVQRCASTGSFTATTATFDVFIPVNSTVTATMTFSVGCTDRDGDTRWATYVWSVTVSDNGRRCNRVTNVVTNNGISGPTLSDGAACPAAVQAAPAPPVQRVPGASTTRQGGAAASEPADDAALDATVLDTTG